MSKPPRSLLDEALDTALRGIGPLALMVSARRFRPAVLADAEAALEQALADIRGFRESRESSKSSVSPNQLV